MTISIADIQKMKFGNDSIISTGAKMTGSIWIIGALSFIIGAGVGFGVGIYLSATAIAKTIKDEEKREQK